jgi:transcriptional regulator with XRE-family HTH domain
MRTLREVAAALEAQRQALQITFDELATSAGLTPLAARRALRGETAPRVTTLMALADKLGLELMLLPKPVAAGFAPAAQVHRPLSRVEQLTLSKTSAVPRREGVVAASRAASVLSATRVAPSSAVASVASSALRRVTRKSRP